MDNLEKAIKLVGAWRPLPKGVSADLPERTLHLLSKVVSRLRAQGLVGPRYRPPQRLRMMREILRGLLREPPPRGESPDPWRKAAESLMTRITDVMRTMELREQIALRRSQG